MSQNLFSDQNSHERGAQSVLQLQGYIVILILGNSFRKFAILLFFLSGSKPTQF